MNRSLLFVFAIVSMTGCAAGTRRLRRARRVSTLQASITAHVRRTTCTGT